MRTLTKLIVIFLISLWIGYLLAKDPGVAYFSYNHRSMTMPLWLCILILGLYHLTLKNIFSFLYGIAKKSYEKKILKTNYYLEKYLISLTKQNWSSAEKSIKKLSSLHLNSAILFITAEINHQSQHIQNRDKLIQAIKRTKNIPSYLCEIYYAYCLIRQKNYTQAKPILESLFHANINHQWTLKLLSSTYIHLQLWESILPLLPTLEKKQIITTAKKEKIIIKYIFNTSKYIIKNEPLAFNTWWKSLPENFKKISNIFLKCGKLLIHQKIDADSFLNDFGSHLNTYWRDDLISIYGKLILRPEIQLKQAEKWLLFHPKNHCLLLALSRLCAYNNLQGKAINYATKSLMISASAEAHLHLAHIYHFLGKNDLALTHYRESTKTFYFNFDMI
jgi:HemY protein